MIKVLVVTVCTGLINQKIIGSENRISTMERSISAEIGRG